MSWLKGVCHEIFALHFFHDSNPSRPLINRVKYCWIWFRFRWDIQIFKKLRGVHPPTAESNWTLRSQTEHCGVKIEINASLWLVLMGQKGEILLGMNTYYMKDNIRRNFVLTLRCDAHRGVEFFYLCDWISWRNRNWIRKYLSLFIRGQDGFESWKKTGVRKSRDTLPLSKW